MKVRKKMKKKHLISAVSLSVLFLLAGCYVTPDPIIGSKVIPMPIPYYGDTMLFDEIHDKVTVKVIYSGLDPVVAEIVRQHLCNSDFVTSANSNNYDIQLNFRSSYELIQPPPNCIMHHNLYVTVSSSAGTNFSHPWQHRSETNTVSSTEEAARARLLPDIKRSVENWINGSFIAEENKFLDVSILRFRTDHSLIEFDPYNFEHAVVNLSNILKSTNGVIAVHLIEQIPGKRIVSFRVLYRKDIIPSGLPVAIADAVKALNN